MLRALSTEPQQRSPSASGVGPAPARLDAPPARSDRPPSPARRFGLSHFVAVALVVCALALPIWAVLKSAAVLNAGVTGFVALFAAALSVLVGALRLFLQRRKPTALGLAALTPLVAATGMTFAAAGGHLARARAAEIAASDHALESGLREFLVAEAQAGGRTSALLGLANVVGFALGFVLLLLVVRARREAAPVVGAGTAATATGPVFAFLFGGAVLLLGGLVAAVWAAVLEVKETPHPREIWMREAVTALERNDLATACDRLEAILAGDVVPTYVLDEHLPGRVEMAHRCVTHRIDALPKGAACGAAAKKLAESETVGLAGAKGRVGDACDR